jgi:uncharacterized membrane protein YdbT with pleckstrin-like domain
MTPSSEPALGLPIERAAAILPADLLQGGEIVILLLKPSPWYILLGCLGTLLAIIAFAAMLLLIQPWLSIGSHARNEIIALTVALCGVRLGWQTLEWLSRTYVLTDRRVIRIKGVLRVEMFQAPLRNISHTEVLFTVTERIFRLGTLSFATAGSAFPEAYWLMVRRPLAVHRRVMQAIHRYR